MYIGKFELYRRTKVHRHLKYCVFHVVLLIAHTYETFVTCITLGRYNSHVRSDIIFSDWGDDIDHG